MELCPLIKTPTGGLYRARGPRGLFFTLLRELLDARVEHHDHGGARRHVALFRRSVLYHERQAVEHALDRFAGVQPPTLTHGRILASSGADTFGEPASVRQALYTPGDFIASHLDPDTILRRPSSGREDIPEYPQVLYVSCPDERAHVTEVRDLRALDQPAKNVECEDGDILVWLGDLHRTHAHGRPPAGAMVQTVTFSWGRPGAYEPDWYYVTDGRAGPFPRYIFATRSLPEALEVASSDKDRLAVIDANGGNYE